jgi:DNA mismatch repair ATPase MutS
LEAALSIATYAYEHPADTLPEIVPGKRALLVDSKAMAHPLIPRGQAVPNDLHLGPEQRLLIISGSNMSGKSTLMRTLGVNLVLAQAGAPVRAQSFRWTPCALGATLRIHDSIQDGTSRFYAEILRLRQILDLAQGSLPLIFLLDELLHGTNSHDRAIGAEAVLRGLLGRGAAGIITTHDLAITRLAEGQLPAARNMHLQDQFEGAELRFDYKLRDGVVQKSNALELMRRIGLEI